jgi:hypothetical protein
MRRPASATIDGRTLISYVFAQAMLVAARRASFLQAAVSWLPLDAAIVAARSADPPG